jgi:hypothetical protein
MLAGKKLKMMDSVMALQNGGIGNQGKTEDALGAGAWVSWARTVPFLRTWCHKCTWGAVKCTSVLQRLPCNLNLSIIPFAGMPYYLASVIGALNTNACGIFNVLCTATPPLESCSAS